MHYYSVSQDMLRQLQGNINTFSQTIATKNAHELLEEVQTIQNLAHSLLSGAALNPQFQKQIFITFTSASNLLQNRSLDWTEEERTQGKPQQLAQMINEVKETLGHDVTLSSITQHPAYIQPQLNAFLKQIKHLNLDQATVDNLRHKYIESLLYKNLSRDYWTLHDSIGIVFREANRGNDKEFLISCMHVNIKEKRIDTKHIYCYAYPATNTWSLSSSNPKNYKFDAFIEHELLPRLRKEYKNDKLSHTSCIYPLTKEEISGLLSQVLSKG